MSLLERDAEFSELERRLAEARAGSGKVVLLSGEAGIGKSTLVEEFIKRHEDAVRALWGTCDALSTPRALGPVHEIAAHLPGVAGAACHDGPSREGLFRSLLEELSRPDRTHVVILEDLHWADEATLDFTRFLARRIQRTHCLLIATYRNDELCAMHPVRAALGDLSGNHIVRLRLTPLSPAACSQLAHGTGRDPAVVYSITGGNPFFVREVLASIGDKVPESVRDAVVARLRNCSAAARDLADLVSLSPGKTELWLANAVLGEIQPAIDECIGRGLLQQNGEALAFRHELARLAVKSTLAQAQARALHARMLHILAEHGADSAQLVHHADLANDAEAVLRYAPLAGEDAARLGAHREAAAHFGTALKYCGQQPAAARAKLLERHAWECNLANQVSQSMPSADRALALWRELGDVEAQARTLHILSRQHWQRGHKAQADACALEAIALLEALPPSPTFAMSCSSRSQLAMLCGDCDEAVEFGERALAIARQFADRATESHALNNIGTALIMKDPVRGQELLEQSLAIALEHDLHENAARAYTNLFTTAVQRHELALAERYLRDGLAYCEERDVNLNLLYLRAYGARLDLQRGNWDEAANAASTLLENPELSLVQRIPALLTLAHVRARRGDPGVDVLLDRALELALPTCEVQRIGRTYVARAEHAWYRGDLARVAHEATLGLERTRGFKDPWIHGELLFWLSRAQPLDMIPADVAEPYRTILMGDWQTAAEAWHRKGMPYERALALSQGSEEALREALPVLERLGAAPAAAMVRRRLRELGARAIPRGPKAATARNAAGLTRREMEVLSLLVDGRTNAQLARRLHLSTKTVDHHVSAILDKLGVCSRAEAIARAFRSGMVHMELRAS